MTFEEDVPPRRTKRVEKLPLDRLSVVDLQEYIAELQEEIARVEADITRKEQHRNAAESFFRKP